LGLHFLSLVGAGRQDQGGDEYYQEYKFFHVHHF
jgi:hypothetical protein